MLVRSSSSVIAIPWPGRHKHSIASHTACKHSFIPPVANPMQDLSSPALHCSQPAFVSRRRARCLPFWSNRTRAWMRRRAFPPIITASIWCVPYPPPVSVPRNLLPSLLPCAVCACLPGRAMVMQQLMIEECCFVGAPDEPLRSMPNDLFLKTSKVERMMRAASLSLFVEKSGWGTRGSS